jgi:hypothetical protein
VSAIILAALLMASGETTPPAVPIEEKAVVSGTVKRDPASGYIYLTASRRQAGIFVRIPDQEEIDAYHKDWEKAFAKAQKIYPQLLRDWPIEARMAKANQTRIPEKPEPPTRETFTIGAIWQRTMQSFGPTYVFAKDQTGQSFNYLTAVKPGTYIWYGPVIVTAEGPYAGVCYCMGSVKFEVKAGVVTDLGNFLIAAPGTEEVAEETTADIRTARGWTGLKIGVANEAVPVRYGLPPSLSAWPSAQADFVASGKIDNFLGVMISRLPPIKGVLAYQRDTVIDEKSGTPVPRTVVPN